MSESNEVELKEFDVLRGEINSRTVLAYTLVNLELTALVGGLATFDRTPEVALAVSAVSSFLWLCWCDIVGQISKIAGYIGTSLRPQLRCVPPSTNRQGPLGWEDFVREFDQGGNHTLKALQILRPNGEQDQIGEEDEEEPNDTRAFLKTFPGTVRKLFSSGQTGDPGQIPKSSTADLYTGLLFGGIPFILTIMYIYRGTAHTAWVGVIAIAVFWVMAVIRFRVLRKTMKTVDRAILLSTRRME